MDSSLESTTKRPRPMRRSPEAHTPPEQDRTFQLLSGDGDILPFKEPVAALRRSRYYSNPVPGEALIGHHHGVAFGGCACEEWNKKLLVPDTAGDQPQALLHIGSRIPDERG